MKVLDVLGSKKTILYPTDTVWGIGCDATIEEAVAKIYEIKEREESKSLIILVSSLEMLQKYVKVVPVKVLEILKEVNKPTTIVYNNPRGLASNVIAKDGTVAIRIVKDTFCKRLIEKLGKPIVSTSANISGEPTPQSFSEIGDVILEAVDYVVNLRKKEKATATSKILRINDLGEVEVIRE